MGPRNGVPATRASRGAPRGDDEYVIGLQARRARSPDFAGAVLRRGDELPVLSRTGDGAEPIVDVPLVLNLGRVLGADGVHLHHHLGVVRTKRRLARLHSVGYRAL